MSAPAAMAAAMLIGAGAQALSKPKMPSLPPPPPPTSVVIPPSPTQVEQAATAEMGAIQPGQLTSGAYLDVMAGRGFGPRTTMVSAATSPSLDSKILQDIYSRLGF